MTLPVQAGDLTIPNTFTAGSPAVAAEVNANFTAVETAVDDNDTRIAALEAALATLQATVATQATTITALQTTVTAQAATITTLDAELTGLNENSVLSLSPYLVVTSDSRGPLVRFQGVNLQLVNGEGETSTVNGLGNFIVGYDAPRTTGPHWCMNPNFEDQVACEGSGQQWVQDAKTGSHNIVNGDQHSYAAYGGLVTGHNNVSGGIYTMVSGTGNLALGYASTVSGGTLNTVSGWYASISGGSSSTITRSGDFSSISGGFLNTVSGGYASISGGKFNIADTNDSSILGGDSQNTSSLTQTIPALP